MDKQKILSDYKKQEDKILLAQILDKIEFSKQREKLEYTDFLDMYQVALVKTFMKKIEFSNYVLYGGFENAERNILIIYPEKYNMSMVEKNYSKIIKVIRVSLGDEEKGKYTRSLKTVENILKTTPSDIIIDLHRDAVGSRPDYAPTVKIGDDYAAQIMFVIGTNEGGLWHPNWQQNLKFAVKVQQKAEEMYPGLFKPIMLTKSRYNQHTGKYANIIEVGATGNTLEQCLTSMKYLSAVMNEVMK